MDRASNEARVEAIRRQIQMLNDHAESADSLNMELIRDIGLLLAFECDILLQPEEQMDLIQHHPFSAVVEPKESDGR